MIHFDESSENVPGLGNLRWNFGYQFNKRLEPFAPWSLLPADFKENHTFLLV
jgi:hypothetical protein